MVYYICVVGFKNFFIECIKNKKIFLMKNVNYDLMFCFEIFLKKKYFILKGLNIFFFKISVFFFFFIKVRYI